MRGITVGFEMGTAKKVDVNFTHLFIGGTTGTGKSELMRGLIERSDTTILIIDVKRPRDYADFNADIPLYVEKQLEPLQIKGLIESTEHLNIKKELPELIRIAEVSDSWEKMLEVAQEKIKGKIHAYTKDVLQVLIHLFKRLVKEMARYQFAKKLELPSKVNVMNISELSDGLQQIIVASVLRYIYNHKKKIVVVVDEAHRFIPEGTRSGSSEEVIQYIREGRAGERWLWMADQTVTGVDKGLLKQMQVWILGRQPEINEAERTLKQIPQRKALKLTRESVQTLGLGEFIVVTSKGAWRVYAWPRWIADKVAKQVAKGDLTAEEVDKIYKKVLEGDDERMWKHKYESEAKRVKALEERVDGLINLGEKAAKQAVEFEKKFKKSQEEIEKIKAQQKRLTSEAVAIAEQKIQQRDRTIDDLKQIVSLREQEIERIKGEVGPLELPDGRTLEDIQTVDEMSPLPDPKVDTRAMVYPIPRADIFDLIQRRIDQLTLEGKAVVQVPVTKAIHEKIAKDWMDTMAEKLEKLPNTAKQAARIISQSVSISHSKLYELIRQRPSRSDPSFSRDYINPLLKIEVISKGGQGGSLHYSWNIDLMIQEKFDGILEIKEVAEIRDWMTSMIL